MTTHATTLSRALAAAALSGGLLLVGCSDGEDKSDAPAAGALDEYMQVLYGYADFDEANFERDHTQREEAIAHCMTERGWEYIPVPFQQGSVTLVTMDPGAPQVGPEWGTVEYAEQYGYGVFSSPDRGPTREPAPAGEQPAYVDPNDDYLGTLGDSERDAYYEALYGTMYDAVEELDENGDPVERELDRNEMGCAGEADSKVQGHQPYEDPEFAELVELLDTEVWGPMEGNEDMAALEAEWSSCMAAKGYTFATRNEAEEHIYGLMDEVFRVQDGQAQQESAQAQEIKQAVADFGCNDEIEYDDRHEKILLAAQQKFVDEHKAKLDALVAKYGDG